MRSDSVLNTGMTSSSVNKVAKERDAREERARLKDEKRRTLKPAAEVVITEIDKELANTQQKLLEAIKPDTTDKDVKSIIVSLNLYSESMKSLKSRISNIMRTRGKE